jgi:hypothetical protein
MSRIISAMLTGSFAGKWWLPGHEDDPRVGTLHVSNDELALALVGSFTKLRDLMRLEPQRVVLGQSTDGRRWTLINSLPTNETMNSNAFDVRASTLRPGGVICGAHLEDPVAARWRVAAFEMDRLTAWASMSGFARHLELTPDRHLRWISNRYDVPDDFEFNLPGARLTIGTSLDATGDLVHEASLRASAEIHVELGEPATADEINRRWLKPLLNLLTIATQKPTALVRYRVSVEGGADRTWLEIIQRRTAAAPDARTRLLPQDALFTLPDWLEAAPDGMARWARAAKELERPLELLASIRDTPRLFLDHRFINVATAAEAFHIARVGGRAIPTVVWKPIVKAASDAAPAELRQSVRGRMSGLAFPSFRDRMGDLIARGGDPLRSLIPDPSGTAQRASDIRNPLAHGSAGRHTDRELFDVTDELLLIVEFHILREAGFSEEQAADRLRVGSRSYSGLWLRRRDDESGRDGSSTAFD